MLQYIIYGVVFIWLIVISFFLLKTRRHYFNLTGRTRKEKLDEILDRLIEHDARFIQELESIRQIMKKSEEDAKLHFQKLGVIRFNPFGRGGGEQSFVLALLNEKKSGIVINFIYTHEGVRVYTKKVRDGKGQEHGLTDEEKRAVERAEIIN